MIAHDTSPRQRRDSDTSPRRRSQACPSHGVVHQDFGLTRPSQDLVPSSIVLPRPEPPSASSPQVSPSSSASQQKLKLPPTVRTPPSPTQSSTKVTTTPPTPGSTTSAGTAGSRHADPARPLDEFGFPRISPPTDYFDGDNEETTRNDEADVTEEAAAVPVAE